ncbi:sensor histidine kinase [Nocardioides sp.]|uniref:sensor histidine kinase n=1 Tax=Nocardioides sp. TaxID=35761 RepID=UPI0035298C9C
MSPTTQAAVAALVGALVTAGAFLAWYVSERQLRTMSAPVEPAVPAGIATVLSVLRSSAVVVDADDTVLKASAPAYALGLVSGSELAQAELAQIVAEVRRTGQIEQTELVIAAPTGAPRHVSARVAPLGARQVLVLVEDRTRDRQLERMRRDFVANVSHELKTPVGAIRLLAEAVQDAADDPEAVTRFSGRMLTESERLTRLVQQIIDLSRLQDDDPLESPVSISVDKVIAHAVDTSSTDAESRRIDVVVTGEAGLTIPGNQEQIRTAVANLVANAVAYSGEGTTVVVSAKAVPDAVEISVIDQGIGIPAGDLDRIFERFYRVDPARHRSTGGTGLGLSIVKHVAAIHGGEVSVWSVEGQGSTFTLTFPTRNEEEQS